MKLVQWKTWILLALATAAANFTSQADTFSFNDTFGSGSTINSLTPAAATADSASYQVISAKAFVPNPPTATSGDLRFGIASSSSAVFETEALFATNPVVLVLPGDYIQLTIVFTNSSGILATPGPGASQLGVGLYNSGGVGPLPGGTNANPGTLPGYAQNWLGYAGQITGGANRIMTRPAQSTTGSYQDVCLSASTTSTYQGQTTVGSAVTGTVTATAGATYTEVLYITMNGANSLAITNTLYAGPGTSGTVMMTSGGIATNATYLTGGFDALALGYQSKVSGNASLFDVSSISVVGTVTAVTTSPTITQEPVNVSVATNGSCPFNVAAMGYNMTYQWHRNGTNLVDGGNISGSTSSQLVINNASTADVASGANGYYVTVTGVNDYSTNSTTNSLTLVPAQNLTWNGGTGVWDLNTTANWLTNGQPAYFNYGDNVTFDNTATLTTVSLSGNYLSASSVTVNASYSTTYTFQGTGSFAGAGSLNDIGPEILVLNNANTYTGGTLISNAEAYVQLANYAGLGTGPLTLALAGGILETTTTGGSAVGIAGDVNILDDFKIQVDGNGTYATVFLGDLSGTTGKTLTINPQNTGYTNRFRAYGINTSCNANIALDTVDSAVSQAIYNGTVLAPYGASGIQAYNGVISGVGGIVQRGNNTTILNAQNTYSGGTFTTAGSIAFGMDSTPTSGTVTSGPIGTGPLWVAPEVGSANGSGTVQANNGPRTIANPIEYPSSTNNQTLIIGGTNALTFTGGYALNGQDGSSTAVVRTLTVNNTAATTIASAVTDGGKAIGLVKTGTGALYLNAANTFTGVLTNSAGLVAGSGSVAGSVVVSTNASIGGGSATGVGTLSVGGNLTLSAGGGGFFRLNRAGTSDQVSVTGTAASGSSGTITVTNLGAAFQSGDTFTLFNKAVTGGAALTVTGGGVTWINNLAVNGTIQVPSLVNTTPTNIVATVSSGVLTMGWPADHTGWYLQVQTNALSQGLGTNWSDVAGSSTTNSVMIPLNVNNPAVFYRMSLQP